MWVRLQQKMCPFLTHNFLVFGKAVLLLLSLTAVPASSDQSLAEKAEMFAQLSKLPLAKNPFFVKSIALSGQFDGEGTEGLAPDFTGYSCRWIGNLECPAFKFQCDGSGIVDCTGSCPGDEKAVSKMMSMMEDKQLQEEFPLLAQMKAEQGKDPEKAKAGKERFIKILKGCGFTGLVALAGLSDGIDFTGAKDSNNSLTHVDEGALSGFDYDYEEEGDVTTAAKNKTSDGDKPEMPDKSDTADKESEASAEPVAEPSGDASTGVTEPKPSDAAATTTTTTMTTSKVKRDSDDVTSKKLDTESAKPENLEADEKTNIVESEIAEKSRRQIPKRDSSEEAAARAMPLNKQPENEDQALRKLHSEVEQLRSVFLSALDEADGLNKFSRRKRSTRQTDMILSLAEDLENMSPSLRRRIRSVAENMSVNTTAGGNETVEAEKCKVQNMSCVLFPTTAQCSGIAMGGCMSHRKLLASIFTPRVIMMVAFGIIVIALIGFGIAIYIHKRKTSQIVEPEAEDPNKGPRAK